MKVLREVQIMEHLHNQSARTAAMKGLFAGLIDAFAPHDEIKSKQIENLFLVMPLGEMSMHRFLGEA